MAVIADDSPAPEKVIPANIPVITIGSLAQEARFSTDKSKTFSELCDIDHDCDQEPFPPPEVTTEEPDLLPAQKRTKNRRKRRRRSKKIKAVVVIKSPRPTHGIFSGKFNLKLPKKIIGNHLLIIALCSILQYQLAHSASFCMQLGPKSDFPIIVSHNDQNVILQKPTFCPEKLPVFQSCSACFREESQLEITCSNEIELWVKHGGRNGDETLVRMMSEVCDHFVKKNDQNRMKRSAKRSLSLHPKVHSQRKTKTPGEEKNENVNPTENDDEICSFAVLVTDPPIVIVQDGHPLILKEAALCPKSVGLQKSCSACFRNRSAVEMSCRKHGDGDYGDLWIEHGKGRGLTSRVEMTSYDCHKIATNGGQTQAERSAGETSAENTQAGSSGASWPGSGVFVIPLIFSVLFTSGFV